MDLLAESALRVTLLAFVVAIVLRALRIREPRLVHRAWTAVAVVMLLLPAFVAWGPELAMPFLPAQGVAAISSAGNPVSTGEPTGVRMTRAIPADGSGRRITWTAAALTVYVAGMAVLLARLAIGVRRARALRRSAVHVHGRLTHPACVTPLTIGIFAPVVILPPDWASWTDAELSAVLAHEEEHVRRRDPLAAGVALLNRAIFWFHPLAWWLQRTIARVSEEACDTVVISRGHDTDVYAACLVRFARRAADAGGRIAPTVTAMPGAGLRERLGMLAHQLPSPPSRLRVTSAVVAGVAAVVVCSAAVPGAMPSPDAPFQASTPAAWPIEASEHFEIVHDDLSADDVSHAVRDVEAAYAHVSAALKHDMARPIRVILVRRDRDIAVQALSGVPQGDATRSQRVVISLESLDRRPGIVVHELAHRFAFEIVPETSRIAPVLIEGLAEHLRGAWRTDDWTMTREASAAGAIPDVAALVDTDRHWAHAVFDFVGERYGEEGIRRLLFALRARETLAPAVPMAFGITTDQFQQEFRDYMVATFGQP